MRPGRRQARGAPAAASAAPRATCAAAPARPRARPRPLPCGRAPPPARPRRSPRPQAIGATRPGQQTNQTISAKTAPKGAKIRPVAPRRSNELQFAWHVSAIFVRNLHRAPITPCGLCSQPCCSRAARRSCCRASRKPPRSALARRPCCSMGSLVATRPHHRGLRQT